MVYAQGADRSYTFKRFKSSKRSIRVNSIWARHTVRQVTRLGLIFLSTSVRIFSSMAGVNGKACFTGLFKALRFIPFIKTDTETSSDKLGSPIEETSLIIVTKWGLIRSYRELDNGRQPPTSKCI